MRSASAQRIEIIADEAHLSEVRDFVDAVCAAAGFTPRAAANIRLAVDEACTNIIKHAYAGRSGTISIACGTRGRWLEIRILDRGAAFEGRIDLPQLGQLVESRRKGGLGVFLMHRLMDQVEYQTTPAGNEWTLRKHLPQAPSTLAQRWRARWARRAAGVLVAVSAIAAAPLWIGIARQRDGAELQSLRAQVAALAEVARPVLAEGTPRTPGQSHLVEVVFALARQEPRLLSIDVVDAEGRIWAADRAQATFTRYVEPVGLGAPDAAGTRIGRTRIDGVDVVHLALPVRGADGRPRIGMAHVAMRWDGVTGGIRAARARLLAAALAVDVLLWALVAAALTAFLRPLQRLSDGVRSLSHDGRALAEDGPEEIGAIAQAFNDMQARYRVAADSAAEHEQFQHELRLARDIQAAILPQAVPEIPGYEIARLYRPASDVGGDYYDFLDAGAGLTGVAIADVAGKGVPGSLVMGMIRTALRMETRRNADAGDVLARLHQFLAADMRNGMFVTMLYVVLDTRHRVVSYASAGHPPMMLYRAASDETSTLVTRGLPLGLAGSDSEQFDSQLAVARMRLSRGDLLLLYTDGVTEACNAAGETYGSERLAAAVQKWGRESAAEFVRRLEADLNAFIGSAAASDDLTLVAIKELVDSPVFEGALERKLVDLVETEGVDPGEACRRLKLSPTEYARLARDAGGDIRLPVPSPAIAPVAAVANPLQAQLDAAGAGEIWLVVESSLDSASCDALLARLAVVADTGTRMVVDLSRAAYVSSRAWGLLAQAARTRPLGTLALSGLRPEVESVYRTLRFDSVLPLVASRGAAPATVASPAMEPRATPAVEPQTAPAVEPQATPAVEPAAPAPAAIAAGTDCDVFEGAALRAEREPYGTSGRALLVVLRGQFVARDVPAFAAWLEAGAGGIEWTLVDARALGLCSDAAWEFLHVCAGRRSETGARLALVAERVLPPPALGLMTHATLASALRARRAPADLLRVQADAGEFVRDAGIRDEGWDAYLRLVRQMNTETTS